MLFVISCIKVLDTPDCSVFLVSQENTLIMIVIFYYTSVENGLLKCALCKTGYTRAPPAGTFQPCLKSIWIYTLICVILNAFN